MQFSSAGCSSQPNLPVVLELRLPRLSFGAWKCRIELERSRFVMQRQCLRDFEGSVEEMIFARKRDKRRDSHGEKDMAVIQAQESTVTAASSTPSSLEQHAPGLPFGRF